MPTGAINPDGKDGLIISLDDCPLCDRGHTTQLSILERKVLVDGTAFRWWTQCPLDPRVILVETVSERNITAVITELPALVPEVEAVNRDRSD